MCFCRLGICNYPFFHTSWQFVMGREKTFVAFSLSWVLIIVKWKFVNKKISMFLLLVLEHTMPFFFIIITFWYLYLICFVLVRLLFVYNISILLLVLCNFSIWDHQCVCMTVLYLRSPMYIVSALCLTVLYLRSQCVCLTVFCSYCPCIPGPQLRICGDPTWWAATDYG